jgi:hypothetical protein
VPREKSRLGRLSGLTAVAALALGAAPAAASAAECSYGPSAPVFAAFGDTAQYYLAPGGSFEGTLGWARSGAAIVAEADPFRLTGLADTHALRLRAYSWAITPKLCVSPETPHLRFVVKARGSGGLDVEVRLYGSDGEVTDSSSGSVSESDHVGWSPSRTVDLKVDNLAPGETGLVDVRFESKGDWRVDDVFVDPYRRG